jgi:transcriptional accessory protein Tex/SPT6
MQMTEGRIIHSYLFEKLRQTPYLQRLYEQTIQDIATQLTTPDVLGARIDSIIKLIESSVKWDKSLRGQTVGTKATQTINEFYGSFDKGIPNRADQLIGLKEWIRIKHATVRNLFG